VPLLVAQAGGAAAQVSGATALVGEVVECTSKKNKTVRITNRQSAQAEVYINFSDISQLKPSDLPFLLVTGPLNCQFTLAANSSQDIPNPAAKYLDMALAFNAPVRCGSTKAEVLVNNPAWCDIEDVSVVDGFNEKIQMNLTPTGRTLVQLGPPVGQLGNQNVFGVFPYGCTTCVGILNPPCGNDGVAQCKSGSEHNPSSLCQYQMNETTGLVEVLLLPK
jgi:hypothetical protein